MLKLSNLLAVAALALLVGVCAWVALDAFVEPHPEVPPLQLAPSR